MFQNIFFFWSFTCQGYQMKRSAMEAVWQTIIFIDFTAESPAPRNVKLSDITGLIF